MKNLLAVAAIILSTGVAVAQHAHSKGPNGGPLEDVAGVHIEMVASGRSITFNILDDANKPMSSKGFAGSAMITSGTERETVSLNAAENSLKGEAIRAVEPGSTINVTLKTADGKSGQARFKN